MTSTDRHLWCLARNANGRPMLQHAVTSTADAYTVCDRDTPVRATHRLHAITGTGPPV